MYLFEKVTQAENQFFRKEKTHPYAALGVEANSPQAARVECDGGQTRTSSGRPDRALSIPRPD